MTYFEVKVRYQREIGDGKLERRTENYLVQSDYLFGLAEQKVINEVSQYSMPATQIDIVAIKKVVYNDAILKRASGYATTPAYYKAKVKYTTIDDSGKEKPTILAVLVESENIEQAHDELKSHYKDTISDYTIESVADTKVCAILD